ncbi:MAG: response regulator [Candidatus Latescibacteria bacterium]|nr:response regulator [Candidatus Latescibacterota bacterium]NIO55271.1 response regulator [Candidatus Latescibacterota bacterium]
MKIRVLVVDDEKEFVEALSQRLKLRNFEVLTAFDGDEAISCVKDKDLDVVVLDVRMPGRDGIGILSEIKQTKPLVEVIMLTGHATVPAAIEGMKLGAFDFLLKPTETDDLVTKIQNAYNRKAEHEERIRKAEINGIMKRRGW